MTRIASIVTGITLVLIGSLYLGYNLLATRFALPEPAPWRLWPLAISAVGLLFLLPPALAPSQRVLAVLFIPGVPILIVGGLATLTLFLPASFVWSTFWPQIVLGLALGVVLLARYLRAVWLILPAAVFGALGAALQFSAVTGWWSAWSVLWAVVPVAIGLALAAIGWRQGSRRLSLAGLLLCAVIGLGAVGLGGLLIGNWGLVNAAGALVLIGAGLALSLIHI